MWAKRTSGEEGPFCFCYAWQARPVRRRAQTDYVGIGGSDSNPGTLAQPLATIQQALNVVLRRHGRCAFRRLPQPVQHGVHQKQCDAASGVRGRRDDFRRRSCQRMDANRFQRGLRKHGLVQLFRPRLRFRSGRQRKPQSTLRQRSLPTGSRQPGDGHAGDLLYQPDQPDDLSAIGRQRESQRRDRRVYGHVESAAEHQRLQ